MRIGLSGAFSCGKTTVAKMLAEKLKLPLIKEQVRELCKDSIFKVNRDMVDSVSLQVNILLNQYLVERKYKSFVSDRTCWDCLAYTWLLLFGGNYYALDQEEIDIREDLLESCEAICCESNYDFVFYFPPILPIKLDKFRLFSEWRRYLEANTILSLLMGATEKGYIKRLVILPESAFIFNKPEITLEWILRLVEKHG